MLSGGPYETTKPLALWHFNMKINANDRGFNLKFHFCEKNEADAMSAAADIGTRYKLMLPTDCEVFYATVSRDDHATDSRVILAAMGVGAYVGPGLAPPTSVVNADRDAVLVRFENADGTWQTRKFPGIPDDQVEKNVLVNPIAAVVGTPIAVPVANVAVDAWQTQANNLFKTIMFYCSHVFSKHAPGGAYTYSPFKNAYALRVGSKKGGRVFI